mmetsp:Transcript_24565/g.61999  ORF Transcript_24565/g.61999 Transcript_24565/m.61999 type:complete len:218 (+) Transcript_24565:672-1325(+)
MTPLSQAEMRTSHVSLLDATCSHESEIQRRASTAKSLLCSASLRPSAPPSPESPPTIFSHALTTCSYWSIRTRSGAGVALEASLRCSMRASSSREMTLRSFLRHTAQVPPSMPAGRGSCASEDTAARRSAHASGPEAPWRCAATCSSRVMRQATRASAGSASSVSAMTLLMCLTASRNRRERAHWRAMPSAQSRMRLLTRAYLSWSNHRMTPPAMSV